VLAVISQPEVVDKVLDHVGLPVEPDVLADGCSLAFDVRDEAIQTGSILPIPNFYARRKEINGQNS
jgi:hypothetical protein